MESRFDSQQGHDIYLFTQKVFSNDKLLFLLEFIIKHEDKKANELTLSWGLSTRLKWLHDKIDYSYCLYIYTRLKQCFDKLVGYRVGQNLRANFNKTLWKYMKL